MGKVEKIMVSFELPVYVRKSEKKDGGYMANFEKNIFHIQGWAESKEDAIKFLGERLVDVLEGRRNPLT